MTLGVRQKIPKKGKTPRNKSSKSMGSHCSFNIYSRKDAPRDTKIPSGGTICTDKKQNHNFLIYKEIQEQLQSHI